MKLITLFCITILFAISANKIFCQKTGMQITICDKETKRPIPDVSVVIPSFDLQPQYTGNQGTVFFKEINTDRRILVKASHNSYQNFEQNILFNAAEKFYNIELSKKEEAKKYTVFGRITNQEKKAVPNVKVVVLIIGFPQIGFSDNEGNYRVEIDNNLISDATEYTIYTEPTDCSASIQAAYEIPKSKNIERNFELQCKINDAGVVENIKQKIKLGFLDINTSFEFFLEYSNLFRENSPFIFELKKILEYYQEGIPISKYDFNCDDFLKGPNIAKQPDPNAYQYYNWKNFNYYTRLARWVAINPSIKKESSYYESFAKQKFCGITQYLMSKPLNETPIDSTFLGHLLKTHDNNYDFFTPTLILALYRKKSTKEENKIDLMFRYPAYNLSSNDMINYPLEQRDWYIAAIQKEKTLIFPFGLNGFTCGLSYPYTDYRLNIQTRTCWCSKIDESKGEEYIIGVDFSVK